MGNECSPPPRDEEEEAYERWLEELAETCKAEDKPCEGCQQGGICDGFLTDQGHRPDFQDFPSSP